MKKILRRCLNALYIVITISVFSFFCWLCKGGAEIERQSIEARGKYRIRVSNWVGGGNYYCDRFEQNGNTYKLYDKYGRLTGQFTLSGGYVCTVSINNGY